MAKAVKAAGRAAPLAPGATASRQASMGPRKSGKWTHTGGHAQVLMYWQDEQ